MIDSMKHESRDLQNVSGIIKCVVEGYMRFRAHQGLGWGERVGGREECKMVCSKTQIVDGFRKLSYNVQETPKLKMLGIQKLFRAFRKLSRVWCRKKRSM